MDNVNAKKNIGELFEKIINIGLYIGFVAVMVVCIYEKTNLHCDEVYTYVMTNNTTSDAITVAPNYYHIYEEPEKVWLDRMTVQEGERFNFANVWVKQAQDNHPPLYYSLVHIICSFFPNVYSKWFAGSVNIILGLLTLYILRLIVKELTGCKYSVFLVTCSFIFSAGVLSALTFFRMYVAAMFWVTLISYIFLKGVDKRGHKFYVALFLTSVAGALTHYYFVIYLFLICLVFGIWLLFQKQWKHVGIFMGTMLLAGGTAVLVFPAMIGHVFGGTLRGTQTMDELTNGSWSYFVYKLRSAYAITDSQLFGSLFAYLLAVGGVAIVIKWVLHKRVKDEAAGNKKSLIKWLLLWIPVVTYFIAVSKIAVFITDRYFHPIYGLLILLVVTSLCVVMKRLMPTKVAFAVLMVLLLIGTFREFGDNWFYLYRGTQSFLDTAATHSDKDCIHVFHMSYEIDPAFYEIRNYDRVVFVPAWDIGGIENLKLNTENGLILSIGASCDFEAVRKTIQETWPELKCYEGLGGHSFSVTYYFHK